MSEDVVPLPPDLEGADRILYKGIWLSEVRQPVELKGVKNAVQREIWVRLPSGKDKKWHTNEPVFSALEGHQVGALVATANSGDEFLTGMVNYTTGEKRVFWTHNRPGCGCALWIVLAWALLFVEGASVWRLYAWLAAFVALSVLTFIVSRTDGKARKLDKKRLDYLAAAGTPPAP
jgi:hypothetical protein